jgi:hypothetical protein
MKTKLEELRELAQMQADTIRWLYQCPQWKADGFFETGNTLMGRQREELVQLALSVGDEALTETIRAFVDEGELPMLPDGEDMPEENYWEQVVEMTKWVEQRGAK